MMKRKDLFTTILFTVMLFTGFFLHVLIGDRSASITERRALRRLPAASKEALFSGEWMRELERYLLDQFPGRDALRGLKAATQLSIFRLRDNHGIYIHGNQIYKLPALYQPQSAGTLARKINGLREAYFPDARCYVAMIPDKGQYGPQGYFRLPFEEMEARLREELHPAIAYIPIKDCLGTESYYDTDIHWRQEALWPLVERLGEAMGFEATEGGYSLQAYHPFYGGYYGQAALWRLRPDTLYYMTSDMLMDVKVEDMEHPALTQVYYEGGLGGMDSYDVFLNGAAALVKMKNPNGEKGRRLIIFRDSFGSSIAPLLIGAYDEVLLVDLRYMQSGLLEDYVEFAGAEVLFLYGEQIVNNSMLLK